MGEEGRWGVLGEVGKTEGFGHDTSGWYPSRCGWRALWQLDVLLQKTHREKVLRDPILVFAVNDDVVVLHDARPVGREILWMDVSRRVWSQGSGLTHVMQVSIKIKSG
jgi:hypothetical protein